MPMHHRNTPGGTHARRLWRPRHPARMIPVIDLASSADVVVQGNNADVLPKLPDESFQLIYIDPPFNTGGRRDRRTLRTTRDDPDGGDRTGFGGRRYATVEDGRTASPGPYQASGGILTPPAVGA